MEVLEGGDVAGRAAEFWIYRVLDDSLGGRRYWADLIWSQIHPSALLGIITSHDFLLCSDHETMRSCFGALTDNNSDSPVFGWTIS